MGDAFDKVDRTVMTIDYHWPSDESHHDLSYDNYIKAMNNKESYEIGYDVIFYNKILYIGEEWVRIHFQDDEIRALFDLINS